MDHQAVGGDLVEVGHRRANVHAIAERAAVLREGADLRDAREQRKRRGGAVLSEGMTGEDQREDHCHRHHPACRIPHGARILLPAVPGRPVRRWNRISRPAVPVLWKTC